MAVNVFYRCLRDYLKKVHEKRKDVLQQMHKNQYYFGTSSPMGRGFGAVLQKDGAIF